MKKFLKRVWDSSTTFEYWVGWFTATVAWSLGALICGRWL